MKTKWTYDDFGDKGYNAIGAFEATLINLNIVKYDNQWLMEQIEAYSLRFKENEIKEGFYGKHDYAGSEDDSTRAFEKLQRLGRPRVNFGVSIERCKGES